MCPTAPALAVSWVPFFWSIGFLVMGPTVFKGVRHRNQKIENVEFRFFGQSGLETLKMSCTTELHHGASPSYYPRGTGLHYLQNFLSDSDRIFCQIPTEFSVGFWQNFLSRFQKKVFAESKSFGTSDQKVGGSDSDRMFTNLSKPARQLFNIFSKIFGPAVGKFLGLVQNSDKNIFQKFSKKIFFKNYRTGPPKIMKNWCPRRMVLNIGYGCGQAPWWSSVVRERHQVGWVLEGLVKAFWRHRQLSGFGTQNGRPSISNRLVLH